MVHLWKLGYDWLSAVFALITSQLNSTNSEIFRKNFLICRHLQLGSLGRNRNSDHIDGGTVTRLTTEPNWRVGVSRSQLSSVQLIFKQVRRCDKGYTPGTSGAIYPRGSATYTLPPSRIPKHSADFIAVIKQHIWWMLKAFESMTGRKFERMPNIKMSVGEREREREREREECVRERKGEKGRGREWREEELKGCCY